MTILLHEETVEKLLSLEETIPAVEDIFRLFGNSEAVNQPRQKCPLRGGELRAMPASAPGYGFGIKVYTLGNKGLRFAVLLYDEKNGDLEAVIEGSHLGKLRTAAVAAIATKYLARSDAACLGLFGTGGQAEHQLRAVLLVRPIELVLVFSPNKEHRETFASRMTQALGIQVKSADSPAMVVKEADVITSVTKAKTPLFDGDLLRTGTHINAIGSALPEAREIDGKTVKRTDCIFIDDLKQGQMENGDLIAAVAEDLIAWTDVIELGSLVAGKAKGRKDSRQITLFESQGIALQDLAAARLAYRKAIEKGVGETLPQSILG